MAPTKRPAEANDFEPPQKRRGRPSKSENVDENPVATEAAKTLVESNEPVDASEIDELVGYLHKPPDGNWTAEEEAEVDRLWDESPEKEAWSKMSEKSHPLLLPLFKVCLRVRRRNPLWLISPPHGLRYYHPQGDGLKHVIYLKTFSQLLTQLIVHPCFRTGVVRLVFAIQYAVVCRYDDRRSWLTHNVDMFSGPDLTGALRAFQSCGGSRPVHEIHGEARANVVEGGETLTRFSGLLFRIGEIVKAQEYPQEQPPDEFLTHHGRHVLPVTTEDLDVIRQAIDNSYNCTTAEALDAYKAIKKRQELPDAKRIKEFMKRGYKELLRYYVFDKRSQPEQANNDNVPRPEAAVPSIEQEAEEQEEAPVVGAPVDGPEDAPDDSQMAIDPESSDDGENPAGPSPEQSRPGVSVVVQASRRGSTSPDDMLRRESERDSSRASSPASNQADLPRPPPPRRNQLGEQRQDTGGLRGFGLRQRAGTPRFPTVNSSHLFGRPGPPSSALPLLLSSYNRDDYDGAIPRAESPSAAFQSPSDRGFPAHGRPTDGMERIDVDGVQRELSQMKEVLAELRQIVTNNHKETQDGQRALQVDINALRDDCASLRGLRPVQGGLTGQAEGPGTPVAQVTEAQATEAQTNEIAKLRRRVAELENDVSAERSRFDRADQQVHQEQEATRQAKKRAQQLRKQIAAAQAHSSVRGSSRQLSSDIHHDQDDRDSDTGGSEVSASRQVLAEHEEPTRVQVALEEPGQSNCSSLPGVRKGLSTLPSRKTTSVRYPVSQRFFK
ncbi:uncharacterized protein FIESC28_07401 [Fusarium coffeatum]|uniref:Uncharacterized protein n=1 Tax=Fusarium coffeatum TaxID=231269 RepID=A0A366RDK8_9HYPO|nr:uncharacterized protein FIESC28_07401 [Fusarium coffeatum]RBR15221.1 hypothetical protein FIESC28_07401 [Fusarium coffeatum]